MKRIINLSQLWAEACGGNTGSYALIHKNLFSDLYYYLLRMLKDDELAEDILQDLFIKMWEKRCKIGPIAQVRFYFFRSARSMAINHIKKEKVRFLNPNEFDTDFDFSPEDVMVKEEESVEAKAALLQALNTLPNRQREILYLKYYDGWSYEEISGITGIRYQSVVNHVHRAVLHLRREFTMLRSYNFSGIAV